MDATVVVPTRDRSEALRRCVGALAAQRTDRAWELVVVDDGSQPPVPGELPGAPAGTRVIRGPGAGAGRARNLGWREASAPVVVFTDDDCEPSPDWLESALQYLDSHPEAVGVEGPTESLPWDPLYAMSVESKGPGGYLTANLALRRSVLEQLGGFSADFPMHCEDYDLVFRAQKLGEIGFAPGMRVLHHPRPMTAAQLAARGRMTVHEIELFRRHRERYGRVRRLPARLFPLTSFIAGYGKLLRAEWRSLVRSPRRAGRFARIAGGYMGHVLAGVFRGSAGRSG